MKDVLRNLIFFGLIVFCTNFGLHLSAAPNQPQRLVLTWESDPATSQSVVWRTEAKVSTPQAQMITTPNWLADAGDRALTVSAVTESLVTEAGLSVYHHTARFGDLTSETSYAYRVGDGETWSEWNIFRTTAATTQPFQFVYFGDVQRGIFSEWSALVRQAFAKAPNALFHLYAGDLVQRGKHDNEWGEFFDALGWVARTIPIVPVPGNHDASQEILRPDSSRTIDPLFLIHFALPQNGPPVTDLLETSYYIDVQGLRMIALNTNSFDDPQQLEWLEKVLSDNHANWTIVCHHHPVYSTGRDRDNKELRALLAPLYQKYQVDLVLQGHDHYYGRTNKIFDEQTAPDHAAAPIYAVSVSGAKMYEANPNFTHLMQVMKGETQAFQVLSVDSEKLSYEAWSLDGTLFDSFELQKTTTGTLLKNNLSQ